MEIITEHKFIIDELKLILKLFYTECEIENLGFQIFYNYKIENDNLINSIKLIADKEYIKNNSIKFNYEVKNNLNKYLRRYSKICFYEVLAELTKKSLPWGSLTGIRPTKLFYELKKELGSALLAKNELIKTFFVSPEKAEIVYETVKNQTKIEINDNLVDLYINIPFCTSKCYYCSFISTPLNKCKEFVEPYINALIKEIRAVKEIINKRNFVVKSVYVGGGTPTALSEIELDAILNEITYPVNEFTVEAGRPDTITKEKLDVLKKHNVTRISINPQTFSNKTLKAIGRAHTKNDVINAYNLSKNYNFIINMDLIAGLNNECYATFVKSLNEGINLKPDNITIHTLSLKRTSELKETNGNRGNENDVKKMIDYSFKKLTSHGYNPYYLYKQKNMIGNLENIGYAKPKTECIFNIDSMEEVATIVACGANAISKRFYSITNRIERLPNVKHLSDYINKIDEIINKKWEFFS